MGLMSHAWTVGPRIRHALRPVPSPEARPWSTTVADPTAGPVRLTGFLREVPGARKLLVLIHGLGGSAGSHYTGRAARAADAAGFSCLRLNLRGSDRSGEDYYHAALTADLRAALESPEALRYESILIMGYSLGGHLALRYGTEQVDPRVRAIAAVCAPLDLARCCEAIDRPTQWVYRTYLLKSLNEIYAAVAARRPVPITIEQARGVRSIRRWDDLVVAPRHGFASAADYYEKASAGPRLSRLEVPALFVATEGDPMVPIGTLRPWVGRVAPALSVCWVSGGGHVGFPSRLDLGMPAPPGLEPQVMAWLALQI